MKLKLPSVKKVWKSKYFIAVVCFFILLLVRDNMDIISLTSHRMKLNDLLEEKAWYNTEIELDKGSLEQLTSNPETLEKFAREQYHMKKDDEEIFVLVPAKKE